MWRRERNRPVIFWRPGRMIFLFPCQLANFYSKCWKPCSRKKKRMHITLWPKFKYSYITYFGTSGRPSREQKKQSNSESGKYIGAHNHLSQIATIQGDYGHFQKFASRTMYATLSFPSSWLVSEFGSRGKGERKGEKYGSTELAKVATNKNEKTFLIIDTYCVPT